MTHLLTTDLIEGSINQAIKILPTIWPLKASIAMNPLWDLRDMPYNDALSEVGDYLPVKGFLNLDDYLTLYKQGKISKTSLERSLAERNINSNGEIEEIISYLTCSDPQLSECSNSFQTLPKYIRDDILDFISCYFNESKIKNIENGIEYSLWKKWKEQKIKYDSKYCHFVNHLPLEPLISLQIVLNKMQVKKEELSNLFKFIFSQLIGWHGFVKWLESRKSNPLVKEKASLLEIALIWCCYLYVERINYADILASTKHYSQHHISHREIKCIWQRAFELTYQDSLLEKINTKTPIPKRPLAQFIFCIDVRSEAFRRHLESCHSYEIFSYAGFFGSIFSVEDTTTQKFALQAPALVEPNINVQKKEASSFFSQLLSLQKAVTNKAKEKNVQHICVLRIDWFLVNIFIITKNIFSKNFNLEAQS